MNNQEVIQILKNPIGSHSKVAQLSYFTPNEADMKQWLAGLSLLNMADVSKQVRTTLVELAHLSIDEEKRLELMEMLRYAVHNLISSLNRHYLSQSLVLDSKGIGIAGLVQQLRTYSFKVYYTISSRLAGGAPAVKSGLGLLFSKVKPTGNNQALAIHRAMNELGGLLYETKLLYFPVYEGVWHNLNQLYIKAREQHLLDSTFTNSTNNFGGKTSISQEYMRALLLSVSRTNRLRQSEIKKLYNYSELWSALIEVDKNPSPNDLFLVDLGKDAAPMYITTSKALTGDIFYINATKLLKHLEQLYQSADESMLIHPNEKELLKTSLTNFVAKSIGEPLERGFARHPYEGSLEVAVGLLSVHYHIAGRRQFGEVVKIKEMMEQEAQADILVDKSRHFIDEDVVFSKDKDSAKVDKSYLKTFHVDVVNVSPGGYRVSWKDNISPALKTGEIICLREKKDKPWQVGIIRWVQQTPNTGAEFGIEVLSAKSTACGLKPNRPEDTSSQYLRAILLPEVKSLNRPATLLTPNFNFVSNHRIKIRVGTQEVVAKLGNEYINTQGFNQYDFTIIGSASKTYH